MTDADRRSPEPNDIATQRAADADREAVAERLRVAAGEGRIELWELDEPIPDPVIREYPGAKRLIDPYTGHVYEDSYLVGENNVIVNGKLEYKGQVGVTIVFRQK